MEKLLGLFDQLMKAINKYEPEANNQALEQGIQFSKKIFRDASEVPITPLMKNLIRKLDKPEKLDDEEESRWRLLSDMESTEAEKCIYAYCRKGLKLLNHGVETDKYDTSANILSQSYYDVDCYRNLKSLEDFRFVRPGQVNHAEERVNQYRAPTETLELRRLILEDKVFLAAVMLVMDQLPSVQATNEWHEVSLPYMSKHTNVGYPYWRNDRAEVDDNSGKTYAELTLEVAKRTPITELPSVYGLIIRYQSGGRPIFAGSRITALSLNRLEHQEIEAYKYRSPLFTGYNDEQVIKQKLIRTVETGLFSGCENDDFEAFDTTIGKEWWALVGAMSVMKASNSLGQKLAFRRAVLAAKAYLCDGYTNTADRVFGRIFSGYIDTNRGGGIINAIASTYGLMLQSKSVGKEYRRAINYGATPMVVMGDDNCKFYNEFDHDKFVKDLKEKLHMNIHPSKGEKGVFFLQHRLWKEKDKYIFIAPWTRVLRSTMVKDTKKGLGPYGWLSAVWQNLDRLREWKPAFNYVAGWCIALDEKLQMGRNLTLRQLRQGMKMESDEAVSQGKEPSEVSLFDGDPQKATRHFDANGEWSKSWLAEMLKMIKAVPESAIKFAKDFISSWGKRSNE